jgi:diadenosine tetraphosphatase ApaH/serine/threonine PP2A family protein phosphatase
LVSDIHANIDALNVVLAKIDELHVDEVVCLGDLVGYNATPNECVDVIRSRGITTLCGNHDAVACGLEEPWGFNPIALAAALWTREALTEDNLYWLKGLPDSKLFKDFLAVHGAPGNRNTYLFGWEDIFPHLSYIEEQHRSLCFFGHTHCPGIFSTDGVYTVDGDSRFLLGEGKSFFINPGSVGQPRDSDPRAAFGILDTEKREYEQVRVEYPVKQAAERVIAAGLPQFLAERLHLGR